MTENGALQPKQLNFELFISILTILSWLNFFLFLLASNPDTRIVIMWVEVFLTPVFLLDFLLHWRFQKLQQHADFGPYNWLDLIGSFPLFRWARAPRVYRAARYLRVTEGSSLLKWFVQERAQTAVLSIFLAVILLFEFASIAILKAETGADHANITTVEDAAWWVLVTIATVGYGDLYPVTGQGRFIGSLVIMTGVGLFGILSGYLARSFLGGRANKKDANQTLSLSDRSDPSDIASILAELKAMRQEEGQRRLAQAAETERLEARLQQLETLLIKTVEKDVSRNAEDPVSKVPGT
ncbi:MAG: ion transporter [Chloroflexota bacterium]